MKSLALCVVAGCGRIAFDPVGVGGDGGGSASDCPAFAQFCDGFESGDFSRWSGKDLSPGGTIVASQQRAHSGSFGLAATMPMQSNGAAAAVLHDFAPISSGVLAVREWINTPVPIIDYDGVLDIFDVFQHYVLAAGATNWVVSENSPGGGLQNYFGTPTPPLDTWTCIELDVTFSPRRFELFVDDVRVVDMTPADPAPLYREISVGVARADIAGYSVFVDDVVQADRHIGCQ
jgi:hypothetical protein